jgi:DNA-binding MarR family transcriptional regulator
MARSIPRQPADGSSGGVPPDALMGEVADLLHSVSHRIRRESRSELEPLDVTWAQLRALRAAHRHRADGSHEGARMSELADALHVARRSATSLVDELEAKGWVRRVGDADDRRAVRVELTDAGLGLMRTVGQSRRKAATRVLETLPERDLRSLRDLLARLA